MEKERIKVTGIDIPQSPIAVRLEQMNNGKISSYSDEKFVNPQEAESHYQRAKNIELLKHGLSLSGGFIAGLGLRIIADTNPDALDYSQATELVKGFAFLAAGTFMAKIAWNAVDKYEIAKAKLDGVRKWINSFNEKKEEIVYQEYNTLKMPKQLIDESDWNSSLSEDENGDVQLTLSSELASVRHIAERRGLSEQKPIVWATEIKINEESQAPVKDIKRKKAAATKPRTASSAEKPPTIVNRKRANSKKAEGNDLKNIGQELNIEKQARFREYMKQKNKEELEELGIISYHNHGCSENKCWVCRRDSSLIFI